MNGRDDTEATGRGEVVAFGVGIDTMNGKDGIVTCRSTGAGSTNVACASMSKVLSWLTTWNFCSVKREPMEGNGPPGLGRPGKGGTSANKISQSNRGRKGRTFKAEGDL